MAKTNGAPGETRAQVAELLNEGMSQREIGRRLGIAHGTVSGHVQSIRAARAQAIQDGAREGFPPVKSPAPAGFEVRQIATQVDGSSGKIEKQWIGARLEGTHKELVPDGHLVKGYSTLVDESGKVRAQWIKTQIDQDAWRGMIEAACRALAEDIKPIPVILQPVCDVDLDLCNLYTMTDCHVGMLAWGRETGHPWDLKIAEAVLVGTLTQMIQAAPAAAIGILNQLGDFLHFDSLKAVTPEHGHLLDADSRYQKIVGVAIRILRRVISAMLEKHAEVHVFMHEGNHDPAGSVWLREAFAALYENNPRVKVERSPQPYISFQHGTTMLCFHHGHLSKNDNLPLLFAAKYPRIWGDTTKRYIHVGHRHHVEEKEHPGVKVIQHPTLAAADAYAARGGWLSERQATFMTYHAQRGEVARGIFLPAE